MRLRDTETANHNRATVHRWAVSLACFARPAILPHCRHLFGGCQYAYAPNCPLHEHWVHLVNIHRLADTP